MKPLKTNFLKTKKKGPSGHYKKKVAPKKRISISVKPLVKPMQGSRSQQAEVLQSRITGDMTIMDVMRNRPESVEKLLNMGMGCCGCHFAMMETLEQGCAVHGLDIKKVLKELNKK